MLKFSRFIDLTSCPESMSVKVSNHCYRQYKSTHKAYLTALSQQQVGYPLNASASKLLHKDTSDKRRYDRVKDAEAGMLSGISRKRSMRSKPCWFTEFCNSQCLSHFAVPFINVRAETSVAESCFSSRFNTIPIGHKNRNQP